MASGGGDDDLIRPDTLRRISEEKEMEKLKEVLRKQQKAEEEAHAFHRTFMEQEVNPAEARRNVSAMVRRAAEDGKREVMALRFPSEWCTDKGRAINNFEPHWPETLTGFAKRGYEYYEQELRPAGFKVRAQIIDYPGRCPGRRRPLPQLVTPRRVAPWSADDDRRNRHPRQPHLRRDRRMRLF